MAENKQIDAKIEKKQKSYPLIPLKGITVFPNMVISFSISHPKSLQALEDAMEQDETVFLAGQKKAVDKEAKLSDLYPIGTVAKVKQVLKLPGNLTHIIVEGLTRGKLVSLHDADGYQKAEIKEIPQDAEEEIDNSTQALMRAAAEAFESYMKTNSKAGGGETVMNISAATKPGQMADVMASGLVLRPEEKQKLLEMTDPKARLEKAYQTVNYELDILNLKKEIEDKVRERIDESQREYFLREQIKVIQEELGDKDGVQADMDKWKELLAKKELPELAKAAVKEEMNRFSRTASSSPDSNVTRNYIDYVLSLPWSEETKESLNLKKAGKILDEDHYGMEKVKERILEFLAVRQNTNALHSPIICLVGPPGVGKTSIAKSVARALNRKYVRMSLGGVKDESEIRGHRKTYVGAMPGRILKAMRQAGAINPLMLLDEVDKLGNSYNGDPASALLEVLDAEQNNTFRDHYLELPYDLSKVLFICTANSLEPIQPALRDRMEIITLSSYTSEEKREIAKRHLYPKQLKKHGLKKNQMKITDNGLDELISGYTHEAGVRSLERVIGELCRKTVKQILTEDKKTITVNKNNLESFLGNKKFHYDSIFDVPQVGVVRGLAWTQAGGDTLSVEVNTMKGTGKFEMTGNLGDVMKESAQAAISFIRSGAGHFSLDQEFYKNTDIHIHIPEGAVPKDGPSAGITMATAMVSALTGVPVKNDLAMTGEITIRGRILPIGGLKEKVLAARRAGVVRVILPAENERDMEEIPEHIRKEMEFILVKDMNEVLSYAMVEGGTYES